MQYPSVTQLLAGRAVLHVRAQVNTFTKSTKAATFFSDVILGCNTTSRVFGVGKGVSLRLVQESNTSRVDREKIGIKHFYSHSVIDASGQNRKLL